MKSKYLREINCEYDYDDDVRNQRFEAEKREYGFASYDTWNIDISFFEFIYIIFKMYDEKNIIDTHSVRLNINDKEWNLQEIIDYIINSCEEYLISRKENFLEYKKMPDDFFEILKKVLPYMWW